MNNVIKIASITLASLIMLLIIAGIILVNIINPNDYKPQIIHYVQTETGRQLTIAGDINWSLFPWLGFKIHDISLSNAQGFSTQTFLKLQEADIRLKLWPLFSKQIQIENIDLHDLQLNLAKNSAGITNWQDLILHSHASSPTPTLASTQPATIASATAIKFLVSGINIDNGFINWIDQQHNKNYSIKNINITSRNISTDQTFAVNLSATFIDNIQQTSVKLNFASDINLTHDFNQLSLKNFKIKLNNLLINGNINASNLLQAPLVQGDITIPTFNPRELATSVNYTITNPNPTTFTNASFQSQLAFADNILAINNLKFNLDNTQITGTTTITNLMHPVINFKLAADTLNIDNYVNTSLQAKPGQPQIVTLTKPNPSVSNNSPQPEENFSWLNHLNLQGNLTINELTVMKLKTTGTQLTLDAKDGLIKIENFQTHLYDGTNTSNMSVNFSGHTPIIKLQSQFKDIQMQAFLTDLLDNKIISGTASMALNITAKGLDANTITHNLTGKASLLLEDGLVHGINLDQQIQLAIAVLNQKNFTPTNKNNYTVFDKVSASVDIVNGMMENDNLKIITPSLSGKGAGTVNLVDKTINYQLKVTTDKYTLPVMINGNLMAPTIKVNINDLLQQLLKNNSQQLLQQGRKLLGGLGG